MADLNDIMRELGSIAQAVQASKEATNELKDDFQEERRSAQESRAVIHKRLDDQKNQIAHLETTVGISGAVDAQMRDKIADLERQLLEHRKEVAPHIEDMKRLKTLGWGVSGLIALGGLTIGSIVAYASDAAKAAIKHWLG